VSEKHFSLIELYTLECIPLNYNYFVISDEEEKMRRIMREVMNETGNASASESE
jgi:hypothetical protein